MNHLPARVRAGTIVPLLLLFLIAPALLSAAPSAMLDAPRGSIIAVLGLGFLLGLKHALDADHLIAISTIVNERLSPWSAMLIGGTWGLGHTASLLIAGAAMLLLRPQLPPTLAPILELAVALMIIGLGINLLIRIRRGGGATLHMHEHQHGTVRHWHPHLHFANRVGEDGGNHHWIRTGRKPFLVGMVHGLAGSATLVLLVLAEIPSPALGILYLLIFGIGSIGGMAIMSTLFALPYALLQQRFNHVDHSLRLSAGIISILFGMYMAYEIIAINSLI